LNLVFQGRLALAQSNKVLGLGELSVFGNYPRYRVGAGRAYFTKGWRFEAARRD